MTKPVFKSATSSSSRGFGALFGVTPEAAYEIPEQTLDDIGDEKPPSHEARAAAAKGSASKPKSRGFGDLGDNDNDAVPGPPPDSDDDFSDEAPAATAKKKREKKSTRVFTQPEDTSIQVVMETMGCVIVALGHTPDSIYSYFSQASNKIVELSPSSHRKEYLLTLAPLVFWISAFGVETERGIVVKWDVAADYLMRHAHAAGVYSMGAMRGPGLWPLTRGRVAVHLGSFGQIYDPASTPALGQVLSLTALLEAAGDGMPFQLAEGIKQIAPSEADWIAIPSLTTAEAQQAIAAIRTLSLAEGQNGGALGAATHIVGWLAHAALGGALDFRAHIFPHGPSGTGKSTAFNAAVKMLHGISFEPGGDSTEAGIRQDKQASSWPVLMDEAEADSRQDAERVGRIVKAARSASDGRTTKRGTTGGKGLSFANRSTYLLACINPPLLEEQDINRWVKVGFEKAGEAQVEAFMAIFKPWHDALDESYGLRLLKRLLPRIGVYREVQKMAEASLQGIMGAGSRYARIHGHLIAGYWIFEHDDADLSPDAAAIQRQVRELYAASWEAPTERAGMVSADHRSMEALLSTLVMVNGQDSSGCQTSMKHEISVGRLVAWLAGMDDAGSEIVDGQILPARAAIDEFAARAALLQSGIRFYGLADCCAATTITAKAPFALNLEPPQRFVAIRSKAAPLTRHMTAAGACSDYWDTLGRLAGAWRPKTAVRFENMSKVVCVPVKSLLGV